MYQTDNSPHWRDQSVNVCCWRK